MTVQKHNDEFGWKRGLGAYSKDDAAFNPATKHKYDLPGVKSVEKEVFSKVGPGGGMLSGSGPVSRGGPPRYAPKTGPRINAKRPK